jgi:hypothetical protein
MAYSLNSTCVHFTNPSIPAACDSATTSSPSIPPSLDEENESLLREPIVFLSGHLEKVENAAYIPRASSPSEKPFKIRKKTRSDRNLLIMALFP